MKGEEKEKEVVAAGKQGLKIAKVLSSFKPLKWSLLCSHGLKSNQNQSSTGSSMRERGRGV